MFAGDFVSPAQTARKGPLSPQLSYKSASLERELRIDLYLLLLLHFPFPLSALGGVSTSNHPFKRDFDLSFLLHPFFPWLWRHIICAGDCGKHILKYFLNFSPIFSHFVCGVRRIVYSGFCPWRFAFAKKGKKKNLTKATSKQMCEKNPRASQSSA